ncbi:regulator of G-protein signaling 7-binding protein-like [Ptychodera flava]|uniref:regulator of G-protein signaling 7-binding protein-like n=1 Tax=Ptychodera flava TaxID=63121 RepID=UPI00396A66A0
MNGGVAGRFRPKSSTSQRSRGSCYDTSSVSDLHNAPSIQEQEECNRLIHELNAQVAVYRELLIFVGDKTDSPVLRENIGKIRRKAVDCVKISKNRLLPYVSSKNPAVPFQSQLIQLYGCIELFTNEMKRSYSLIKTFPMRHDFENIPGVLSATGSQIAMATMVGMGNSVFPGDAMSRLSEHFDEAFVLEAPRASREDLLSIQSDIQEVQDILREMEEIMPRTRTPDEDPFASEIFKIGSRTRLRRTHRRISLCCLCVTDSL